MADPHQLGDITKAYTAAGRIRIHQFRGFWQFDALDELADNYWTRIAMSVNLPVKVNVGLPIRTTGVINFE